MKENDAVIKDQLRNGIVEQVQEPTLSTSTCHHYLPYHLVITHDKDTTKIHVVYDASAKTARSSLNECLYVGPPFNQYILDIIIRFRLHSIALAGDIEKAFLMISVAAQDRDVLRFLWVDDPFKETPTIVAMRFRRVVFGVSASLFLLNATIRQHILQYHSSNPELVDQFLRSVYVDDVTYGSSDVEKTYKLYTWSKSKLAEGGFHLRKFVTNSPTLKQKIERSESLAQQVCDPGTITEEDESYAANTLGDPQ